MGVYCKDFRGGGVCIMTVFCIYIKKDKLKVKKKNGVSTEWEFR